jgi:N-formylglutamate deformylase
MPKLDPYPAVIVRRATGLCLPLVCDSPHSGTAYPDDFGSALPRALLRRVEDTDVEALWAAAPEVGGSLVAACFPRSYIDPNRALDDLDPDLLEGPWPTPLRPGEKSQLGYGLIWRMLDARHAIYQRKLSVREVQARIERCWLPYRQALRHEIEQALHRFGGVWHLNLHSMPGNAYARLGLRSVRPLADFVLGDRDGSTCEPGLVDVVERSLRSFGYSVARNDPYKGAALLSEIGQPARNRHSLQIEVRRALYMDEATRERHAGFALLQMHLGCVLKKVGAYVHSRLPGRTLTCGPISR